MFFQKRKEAQAQEHAAIQANILSRLQVMLTEAEAVPDNTKKVEALRRLDREISSVAAQAEADIRKQANKSAKAVFFGGSALQIAASIKVSMMTGVWLFAMAPMYGVLLLGYGCLGVASKNERKLHQTNRPYADALDALSRRAYKSLIDANATERNRFAAQAEKEAKNSFTAAAIKIAEDSQTAKTGASRVTPPPQP